MNDLKSSLKELQTIPGVGKEVSQDLYNISIKKVADLKGKNPEKLYAAMIAYEGQHVDRCMLYVLRCAVYFAETKNHNKKLLKWWNWKDVKKK
jgi:hypothetical protein